MPEYLSPGVYIEEVNTGPRPIEGVGTACAAFVGFAPAGELNKAVLITNWTQYVQEFGALGSDGKRYTEFQIPHKTENGKTVEAYLSHAVYGFFNNGGGRCYVARVGDYTFGTEPRLEIPATEATTPSLILAAKEGVSQSIKVEIQAATGENPPDGSFTMVVSSDRPGGVTLESESYENVTPRNSGANAVTTAIQSSNLITLVQVATSGPVAQRAPKIGEYVLNPTRSTLQLQAVQAHDFIGKVEERTGINGMEVAEDVTMLCCPDLMASHEAGYLDDRKVQAVQEAMIAHCARMGDRLAILDSPYNKTRAQEVLQWKQRSGLNSPYAALYYPWISVVGSDGDWLDVPPSGHVAGIYARSDQERGVHKAPANESVRGAVRVLAQVTQGEQGELNPKGINCIRSFPGRGILVWGARTLSDDAAWRYINVRRLFNYVEKSIERGTQWVVFEPNDHDLWARVRRDVTAFLTGVWRSGALFGLTADQAFFVKCDEETNTPESINQGKLVIEIGLAPVKPAEFVVFRLSQFTGGGA